ncbi:unnamed protein product, partial [Rotaria sp. Silwood2]
MIGILPLTKNNLDTIYLSSTKIFPLITNKIFECWNDIMGSVFETEMVSFEDGVAKLLCLKLWLTITFIPNSKDTSGETISLLRRMPAEEKRQEIINIMLKQLVEINNPLQGSTWTELFDLANPNQL